MPNRVIILEGPDGGGKTTVAQKLRDLYNFKIVKTSQPKPKENLLRSYTESLWEALQAWQPVVLDRHYLGESIYGPIMRGEDRLGEHGRVLIERMISAYGAELVVCLPPVEVGWEAAIKRGEKFIITRCQYDKIHERYVDEVNRLGCVVHDWTDDEGLVAFSHVQSRVLPAGVTGSPTARTLIVGEKPNLNEAIIAILPFHSDQGCSPWLTACLHDAGYHEHELAFVNAYHGYIHELCLDEVIASLPFLKRVVALGDVAGHICKKYLPTSSPPLYQLSHPQYWKRFFAKRRDEYVQMLRDLKEAS